MGLLQLMILVLAVGPGSTARRLLKMTAKQEERAFRNWDNGWSPEPDGPASRPTPGVEDSTPNSPPPSAPYYYYYPVEYSNYNPPSTPTSAQRKPPEPPVYPPSYSESYTNPTYYYNTPYPPQYQPEALTPLPPPALTAESSYSPFQPPAAPDLPSEGWGQYVQRTEGDVAGMRTLNVEIWAYQIVSAQAVINCRRIMEGQLATSPQWIIDNLVSAQLQVPIVGRTQNLTDLPPYRYFKGEMTEENGSWDSMRCIGAPGPSFPYSSGAEEDLLWTDDDPLAGYEVLMVREFARTILTIGVTAACTNDVANAFKEALVTFAAQIRLWKLNPANDADGRPPLAFQDKADYWAVMSEAWFESTILTETNMGINTRAKLQLEDPTLASIFLSEAYGNGTWTYFGDKSLPQKITYMAASPDRPAHRP